ncbi:MAG TPA: SDR family oxidoreductase [Burkholderiales bacterium]|nr:SDR family oxidoreductase [Burkholderiales bacterium]
MKRAKLIQPPDAAISLRMLSLSRSLWRRASEEGSGKSMGREAAGKVKCETVGLQFPFNNSCAVRRNLKRTMARAKKHQRVALVTGAGKRIGRAISLALAADGWDIALHFHRGEAEAERLSAEISALGAKAVAVRCDLSDAEQVPELVEASERHLGTVTCLVNNAAVFAYDDLASLETAQWHRHLDVNLFAPLLLSKTFAARLPDELTGCIVNMLDQKVFNLNPDFLSYTVAKIGLEGATRLLALALAPKVRVCGVAPGITLVSGEQTAEGFARSHRMAPLGRSSTVEDIADAVRFVVNAGALTGTTIVVDGGQHLWPSRRDVQFAVGNDQ